MKQFHSRCKLWRKNFRIRRTRGWR